MKTIAGIASLATLLSGCAHLDQAPLVYSSKTTLGVEVSTASVEAPGLVLTLGFRQIDAAYVPVAVGRPCNPGVSSKCESDGYNLQIVSGRSEAGSNNSGDVDADARRQRFESLTQQVAEAARAASNADQRLLRAQGDEASIRQRLAESNARKLSYETQTALLPSLRAAAATGDPASEEVALVQERIRSIEAMQPEGGISELESGLENATAAVRAAESAHAEAAEQLKRVSLELRNAQQAIEEVKRYDSYSVFGSFETGTRAGLGSAAKGQEPSGDAGISLGKIFATGVASQNISDGLSRFYNSRALTACYDAVAALAVTDPSRAASTIVQCHSLMGSRDNH